MLNTHREEKQIGSISEKYVQRFDTVRRSVTDNQKMAGFEILHHQQLHRFLHQTGSLPREWGASHQPEPRQWLSGEAPGLSVDAMPVSLRQAEWRLPAAVAAPGPHPTADRPPGWAGCGPWPGSLGELQRQEHRQHVSRGQPSPVFLLLLISLLHGGLSPHLTPDFSTLALSSIVQRNSEIMEVLHAHPVHTWLPSTDMWLMWLRNWILHCIFF